MDLTYFKRYRMEIRLPDRDFSRPQLPDGYRFVPWDASLLEAFAEAKYLSFRDEIDANVFPCLGDPTGCRRLMTEISRKPGFLPETTWLAVRESTPRERPRILRHDPGDSRSRRARRDPEPGHRSRTSRRGAGDLPAVSGVGGFSPGRPDPGLPGSDGAERWGDPALPPARLRHREDRIQGRGDGPVVSEVGTAALGCGVCPAQPRAAVPREIGASSGRARRIVCPALPCCVPLKPPAQQGYSVNASILSHTYANGLVLVAEPMGWLESAAFTFLVPAGCVYDPADRGGLSSFTCEMVAPRGRARATAAGSSSTWTTWASSGANRSPTPTPAISGATLADNLPGGPGDLRRHAAPARTCPPTSWRPAGR